MVHIRINGNLIICEEGETIMAAAKKNGIYIPGLCGHPDFPAKGNCRVCLVEVKNRTADSGRPNKLVTSCSLKVEEGMEIFTDTERVSKLRNINIELIFAEHIEKCPTCVWNVNCRLLELARRYKIKITRFKDRKSKRKTYKFANAVEIDGTQCIDCRNCIDACSQMQKINYLELKGKGADQEVVPTDNKKIDCIYCGQCALHCPIGSAQEQTDWEEVEKAINDKSKIVVAQIAPSVRVAAGEEFGMPPGTDVTGQIVTGLRELGFNFVFDVNFAADITTMVEAEELLERVKTKGVMPMFTSCCPAWVKYAEFFRPDLIPNLTTSRSPQIHLGGVIKSYWAEKNNVDPKDIVVVSVMPCTAKKFEADRKEMHNNGWKPVDHVITVREFAYLLKKQKIHLPDLKKGKADSPLGEHSGAAAIYGASGGVMESALRTAQFMACEGKDAKLCQQRLEFQAVRGLAGVKEAVVNVAGTDVRVAVVNGIGNIKGVLDNLSKYDYIEVMACPGGCLGGGGQAIPTTPEIRQKRMEAIYNIDKGKKIRKAHENKPVLEILEWLKGKGKMEHGVLHTKYVKRKR